MDAIGCPKPIASTLDVGSKQPFDAVTNTSVKPMDALGSKQSSESFCQMTGPACSPVIGEGQSAVSGVKDRFSQ